jgi:hypothetical protein
MIVKIPLKLESEANSRQHWHKGAKRHTTQKKITRLYLKTSDIPDFPIHVTLTRFAPRFFDSDNLQTAFKYVRDAVSEYVTDCKIAGRADSDPRISWEYKQEKTKNKEHYYTIEILSIKNLSNSSAISSSHIASISSTAETLSSSTILSNSS